MSLNDNIKIPISSYEHGRYICTCLICDTKFNAHENTKLCNECASLSSNDWEGQLSIRFIPELPHTINSVRELRRYYIDALQLGYRYGKYINETNI